MFAGRQDFLKKSRPDSERDHTPHADVSEVKFHPIMLANNRILSGLDSNLIDSEQI